MDEVAFRDFLHKGGRSEAAINRATMFVKKFRDYLAQQRTGKHLDDASPEDLDEFCKLVNVERKSAAQTYLWGIRYYYEFTANSLMRKTAARLREKQIKRVPFPLKRFRGVNKKYTDQLESLGIRNIEEMLKAGLTPEKRQMLTKKSRIPLEAIEELVKLSDLARIPGIKTIRTRLYYDAGVDTLEKMATWDPRDLRKMLIEFVKETKFNGIAPLPKEAQFSVETAKRLPKLVKY